MGFATVGATLLEPCWVVGSIVDRGSWNKRGQNGQCAPEVAQQNSQRVSLTSKRRAGLGGGLLKGGKGLRHLTEAVEWM